MKIIKNFLDESLFNQLEKKFDSIEEWMKENELIVMNEKNYHNVMNLGSYNTCLRLHGEELKYVPTLVDPDFLKALEESLKSKLPQNDITFQFCMWESGSELEMHYDTVYKFGATLYINDWNVDWGGLFKWKDRKSRKLEFFCPERNSLILNDIDEEHMVTKISNTTKIRRTLQIWGK